MHYRILGEHWYIYSCLQTQHRENWFQIVRWNTQQQLTFPALLPFAPTIDLLTWNIYGTFHVHRNSIFYYFFSSYFYFLFLSCLKWNDRFIPMKCNLYIIKQDIGMFPIAGQTAGPNGLKFLVDTHG